MSPRNLGVAKTDNNRRPRMTRDRIASLSSRQIRQMKRSELCWLIDKAEMAFVSPQTAARMPLQDRVTLERMAYYARRCCQNQRVSPAASTKG